MGMPPRQKQSKTRRPVLQARPSRTGTLGQGKKGTSDRLTRALRMLNLLSPPTALSAPEIGERLAQAGFPSTPKRIRETLRQIRDAGINVFEDQSDLTATGAARWKVKRGLSVGEILEFTRNELLALYLARGALEPLRLTSIYRDVQSAFARLDMKLGWDSKQELKELERDLHTQFGGGALLELKPEVLEAIQAACVEGHVLEIDYFTPDSGKVRTRQLGPRFISLNARGFYLRAEDLDSGQVKTFSISRIKRAQMSEVEYAPKNDDRAGQGVERLKRENLDAVFASGGTVEKVVLDFDPGSAAAYIRERQWHESEEKRPLPNGGLRLTLTLSVDVVLIQWILSFQSAVGVVGPKHLRRTLFESVRAIALLYEEDKDEDAA